MVGHLLEGLRRVFDLSVDAHGAIARNVLEHWQEDCIVQAAPESFKSYNEKWV